METTTVKVNVAPKMVETPNAIYEHCEAFSVVGANTGPSGTIVHIQFARDIATAPRNGIGIALTAESVEITRRICATISIPSHAAEALAKAILKTVKAQEDSGE